MIDFSSVNRRSNPQLIGDPRGHQDCFDWSGHIAARGRIWVDVENHDVLRVERGLVGPVDVKVPVLMQRRHHMDSWVAIMREDATIRYGMVAFSDPDEVLLLPESIDSLIMVRGGFSRRGEPRGSPTASASSQQAGLFSRTGLRRGKPCQRLYHFYDVTANSTHIVEPFYTASAESA
jgi:hypothetical protein